MDDVLIVGGGVVGLTLARVLSQRGLSVCVLDQGPLGAESSWAGSGMIARVLPQTHTAAERALHTASYALHQPLAAALQEETGLSNGYKVCGSWYVDEDIAGAENAASSVELRPLIDECLAQGVPHTIMPQREFAAIDPALQNSLVQSALYLPQDAQLRNPWHVRALVASCQRSGVTLEPGVAVSGIVRQGNVVQGVQTSTGMRTAGHVCLAAGAWTGMLAQSLGWNLPIQPIRGQIALLQTQLGQLSRLVQCGKRYLVPRGDGRVLVGSTEEEAGFIKQNTALGVGALLDFAMRLAPGLQGATLETCWAGLRPGSADGLPTLGVVPDLQRLTVAAGHFRNGLAWSTGTAEYLAGIILNEPDPVLQEQYAAFSPMRHGAPQLPADPGQ